MAHRVFLIVVVLEMVLIGCTRETADRGNSGSSSGGAAQQGGDHANARRRHDNVVRIPPAGADLETADQRVEFGTALQRKLFSHTFEVANTRSEPIVIDGITSSCECFSVPGLPIRIPAKKRTIFSSSIDLSTEPAFHGDLAIEVHLQSGGKDAAIFKAAINVEAEQADSPRPEKPVAK